MTRGPMYDKTPNQYVTDLRLVVRFKLYRTTSNTGGVIMVQVGTGATQVNVDASILPFSQWVSQEFSVTPTGFNPDYGWISLMASFYYPITGGPVYLAELSVEEAKGVTTWQTAGSSYYSVSGNNNGGRVTVTGGQTIALGANAAAMAIGSWLEVYNDSTTSAFIVATDGNTLRLAGTVTTGTRTLAQRALVVLNKVTATEWTVHGAGVT